MMPQDYELDRGIAATVAGPGEYAVHLDAGWVVGGGVNGGYLLAVVGNALRAELVDTGHVDPLTVSAHYLSPCVPGPGRVRVVVRRRGRSRSTVQATLVQEHEGAEVERVLVTAVYGTLATSPERLRERPPVDLPPWEECTAMSDAPPQVRGMGPLLERFASRLDPAHLGWAWGRPSGAGVVQGWFALADARPLDPVGLLLVVDALPPASMDLGRPGWAPTLELTAHVRARPAPGPLRVRLSTRTVVDGSFEEDCEVWDAEGHLVAQSRQLALLPRGS